MLKNSIFLIAASATLQSERNSQCLIDQPIVDVGLSAACSSDCERLALLESKWTAPVGFQWPYSERLDHGQIRRKYLGPQHLSGQYSCFSYSLAKNGVFCKPCALFAPDRAGGVKLDRLVKSPLQKYSHLTGDGGYLTSHIKSGFHEDCSSKATAFTEMMRSGFGDVAPQVNTAAAAEREKNRRALCRIIQAIEFHGRLGLPLRGHRDSGELTLPEAGSDSTVSSGDSITNGISYAQGNLRATLQLMVTCNDEELRQHLSTAGKNATYISPMSQNQLIDAMASVIKREIISQVKRARFFSILADETTDFSRQEQLTVCLRYVLDYSVCERFLCFALAPDLTGNGLATQLLAILSSSGLDKDNMVGQGYDGAAAMSGDMNGVQRHIMNKCPSAVYVHCAAHSLNLCLTKAAEVPEIRAAVTLMHEIAIFFTDSNKRLLNLQNCIDNLCPESCRTRLKKHCATRWVEKQDAVLVFEELYPAILASLESLSSWSGESGNKAVIYTKSLDGAFLVALEILHSVLEVKIKIVCYINVYVFYFLTFRCCLLKCLPPFK